MPRHAMLEGQSLILTLEFRDYCKDLSFNEAR